MKLPFEKFEATQFGWRVPGVGPVAPTMVRSVYFVLSDKQTEPFRLEVVAVSVVPTNVLLSRGERPEMPSERLAQRAGPTRCSLRSSASCLGRYAPVSGKIGVDYGRNLVSYRSLGVGRAGSSVFCRLIQLPAAAARADQDGDFALEVGAAKLVGLQFLFGFVGAW